MKLIADLKSWASKIEDTLKNMWSKAPKFVDVADTVLTFVGPVLETAFTIEAGSAAGAAVTAVISKAQRDLAAAGALISTIGPTPSVKGVIAGVQSNLAGLLTSSQISDPTSVANINLVLNELAALANAFPAPALPASTAGASGQQKAVTA